MPVNPYSPRSEATIRADYVPAHHSSILGLFSRGSGRFWRDCLQGVSIPSYIVRALNTATWRAALGAGASFLPVSRSSTAPGGARPVMSGAAEVCFTGDGHEARA